MICPAVPNAKSPKATLPSSFSPCSFLPYLLSRLPFPSPSKPECTGKDWGLVALPFLSSLNLLLHWVKPIPCSFFTWTTHRSRSHGQRSQGIALVWGVTRPQTARTLEREFSQSSGCTQQPPRRRHTLRWDLEERAGGHSLESWSKQEA